VTTGAGGVTEADCEFEEAGALAPPPPPPPHAVRVARLMRTRRLRMIFGRSLFVLLETVVRGQRQLT